MEDGLERQEAEAARSMRRCCNRAGKMQNEESEEDGDELGGGGVGEPNVRSPPQILAWIH